MGGPRDTSRPPGRHAIRVDPTSLGDADLDAWRALADRAAEPNPFYRPEFLLADSIERAADVDLLVVRDGDRWLACLPVVDRPPSRTLPLPHLEGFVDEYVLCGTPLVDRDAIEVGIDAIVGSVQAERNAAALLLRILPVDGPVADAIDLAAERRGIDPITSHTYERASWRRAVDGEPSGTRLKASDRRVLGRRTRRMQEALGGDVRVVDRTHDPAGWEAFLAMERSGWKEAWGTALGSTDRDAAFFRRMCAAMSTVGHLEIVELAVGEQPVAMEVHLPDGDALFSFKIAYDDAFRPFSPGTQLSFLVIEGLQDQGFRIADSCASADNTHMNWLWPDRRPVRSLLLPSGSRASRLVRPSIWAKDQARRIRAEVTRRRSGAADA